MIDHRVYPMWRWLRAVTVFILATLWLQLQQAASSTTSPTTSPCNPSLSCVSTCADASIDMENNGVLGWGVGIPMESGDASGCQMLGSEVENCGAGLRTCNDGTCPLWDRPDPCDKNVGDRYSKKPCSEEMPDACSMKFRRWNDHSSQYVFDGGRCVDYPETGFCAKFGVTGSVFIFDSISLTYQGLNDFELYSWNHLTEEEWAAAMIPATCKQSYFELLCARVYPTCSRQRAINTGIIRDLPSFPCLSECKKTLDSCRQTFEIASGMGYDFAPKCDKGLHGDRGDSSVTGQNNSINFVLRSAVGSKVFANVTRHMIDGSTYDVPCATGNSTDSCSVKLVCPDPLVSKTRKDQQVAGLCQKGCGLPCPLPFWSATKWDGLLLAQTIPALLSIPLNLVVFLRFVVNAALQLNTKFRGRSNTIAFKFVHVLKAWSASMALLFVVVDTIPALQNNADMSCPKGGAILPDELNVPFCNRGAAGKASLEMPCRPGPSSSCALSETSVYVLQSMIFAVALMQYEAVTSLTKALSLSQPRTPTLQKRVLRGVGVALLLVGLPATLYGISFSLEQARIDSVLRSFEGGMMNEAQTSGLQDAKEVLRVKTSAVGIKNPDEVLRMRKRALGYNVRHAVSCDIELLPVEEFCLVHLPLIVGSFVAVLANFLFSKSISSVAQLTELDGHVNHEAKAFFGKLIVRARRFSAAASVALVAQIAAVASIVPQLNRFVDVLSSWYDCAIAS